MQVVMIGTGYVGLVSGACFADFGHQVTCVDKDADKIEALKRGEIPIYEPGLDELVATNVRAGRLIFATDLQGAVREADAVFIAVGTPSRRGDGHADLSYVYAAAARDRRRLSTASRSSSPSRRCRSAPATRSSGSCARPAGRRRCRRLESGIPARRRGDPAISSVRTASSSAPTTSARGR